MDNQEVYLDIKANECWLLWISVLKFYIYCNELSSICSGCDPDYRRFFHNIHHEILFFPLVNQHTSNAKMDIIYNRALICRCIPGIVCSNYDEKMIEGTMMINIYIILKANAYSSKTRSKNGTLLRIFYLIKS